MDPKIAKKTQDTLGKIIKKPPLTDKLLGKPPFRFLHDIMTSVIKTTGFMKGLYTEAEMNSENVKDKDSKIAFLQKSIDFTCMVTGKSLAAKPSKIVAGHEPERTNEFLVALANAINSKADNDECIKKFYNKGKDSKDEKEDRKKDRSDDKRRKDKEEKSDRGKSADRHRGKSRDRDHEDEEKKDKEEKKDRERSRDRDREERHRDRDRERRKKHRDEDAGKENETPADMMNGEAEKSEPDPPPRMARPTSAKGSRRRREDDETRTMRPSDQAIGEGDLPPQVAAARGARPSSARPAPPKRKQEIVENEPAMRLGSGKPTNVIVDDGKGSDDEDEDETFVVEESAPQPTENEQTVMKPDEEEDGDHGGLVKKMLESKKELEGGSQQKSQTTKKTEIERPTLTDAQRRKHREQIQKEIDKLRGSIQTLTRSANPLGKIMDYVQEDLDSMQKELHKWKAENKEHALALKREKSVTDKAVEPLKAQLSEVDQAIKDQLDLIAAVKSNIIRNDNKIEKMLTTIAKS